MTCTSFILSIFPGDGSLILKSRAKHHAIASKLSKSWRPDSGLVLQYDVQFRNGQECGGAYMKLLSSPSGPLKQVNDKTQYSIMFGPDKCGNDYKLHFIFMHKHPKNGSLREIHWNKVSSVSKLEEAIKDGKWHQLRLHVKPDNLFEIQLDKRIVGSGSLLSDFTPAVNPPQQIDDPHDRKPEDWDEREKIPDPDARKPDDWDETEPRKIPDPSASKPSDWLDHEADMIPDPDAEKPSDWDPEMDGEWQAPSITNPKCAAVSGCGEWKAPLIDNPKFKGKWKPNLIPNPNYKGKWSPRKIRNPDFFEDLEPHKVLPIDAVAFELWTISDGIAFDNVLLTTDANVADHVLDQTFQIKKDLADEESDNFFVKLIKHTNKKPYLWAVYVLVIAVPVILFIAYCCVEPASKKQKDEEIRRKKTDAPAPDYDGPPASPSGSRISETAEDEEEDEVPAASSRHSSKRTSPVKAASPDTDETEEEEVDEEEVEEEDENAVEDGDESDGDAAERASNAASSAGSHASPRQRKTRSRKE
jgi:calnexin